ncbi:hypothetical protein DEJ12_13645 [Curtobacterium sp. MCLR17_059]|nr:hypothetical protein DEJ12_13645 [Curtobacterium sp. MCLR17_059]PZF54027.1 hypothetical protein DEJ10_04845 [Curtobacterium sp. MCLR17_057]
MRTSAVAERLARRVGHLGADDGDGQVVGCRGLLQADVQAGERSGDGHRDQDLGDEDGQDPADRGEAGGLRSVVSNRFITHGIG